MERRNQEKTDKLQDISKKRTNRKEPLSDDRSGSCYLVKA